MFILSIHVPSREDFEIIVKKQKNKKQTLSEEEVKVLIATRWWRTPSVISPPVLVFGKAAGVGPLLFSLSLVVPTPFLASPRI